MANNSVWMVMMVVMLVVTATEAVSCGDAVSALIPCGSFLIGSGPPKPSAECCQSAQTLNKMAATLAARRALCQCLKQTGPSFGVKPERAKQLPPLCKLKLNIPQCRLQQSSIESVIEKWCKSDSTS